MASDMRKLFDCLPVLVLLVIAACSTDIDPPLRPDGVPENAMWIGGIDGGAWVLLERRVGDPPRIYRAQVFGDQVGDKWYVGRLEIGPNIAAVESITDPEVFQIWDGDNLLLKDGRIMVAIDPYDPFAEEGTDPLPK